MQTTSSALHSIGTDEGDVLPFIRPLDFIALALHEDDKILTAAAFLHGIANVVHQPEFPALTFLRRPVFPGRHLLTAALVLGQNTESVCHTDIIADLPQILQRVGVLPELQPSLEVHRVDNEVGMDMVGITMSGHKDFCTGPGTHRKFLCYLMCLPGCDILHWRKGLDILVEVDAVHFSVCCLGRFELQN